MDYETGALICGKKYRVERLIGEGAFAQVYLVTHLNLNIQRAVKVLHRQMPGVGSNEVSHYRERFRMEAQLGARIASQYLIKVYDFEEEDGVLYLVMEYAEGGNLYERLHPSAGVNTALPVQECLQVALDTAKGLAELHKLDIVHRDLSPKNILFDEHSRAKIADLGLAQMPGGPSMRSVLSHPGPHPGAPAYMSPEQETSEVYLTSASDIYGLGCILFEMLSGRLYKGQRPGMRVKELREDVPGWLDELVARMLAKNPEERPWDGEEVAKAIETKLNEEEKNRLEAEKLEKERQEAIEREKKEQEEAQRQKLELEQKQAQLKKWFEEAKRIVKQEPLHALELIKRIESEEPNYPNLKKLNEQANQLLRKMEHQEAQQKKEAEERAKEDEARRQLENSLAEWFAEAQSLIQNDPEKSLTLIQQIKKYSFQYPGLKELEDEIRSVIKSKQDEIEKARREAFEKEKSEQKEREKRRKLDAWIEELNYYLTKNPKQAMTLVEMIKREQPDNPETEKMYVQVKQSLQDWKREESRKKFINAINAFKNKHWFTAYWNVIQVVKEYPEIENDEFTANYILEKSRQAILRYSVIVIVLAFFLVISNLLVKSIVSLRMETSPVVSNNLTENYPILNPTKPARTSIAIPTLTTISPTPTLSLPVSDNTPMPVSNSVINVRNAALLKPLARWGKGTVNQVIWSTDGRWIGVASSYGVYIYNANTYRLEHFFNTYAWVNCILFSSDGEKIIVGLKTGTVYLWDISTEEFIWKKNLGERLLSIASYNDKIAIGTENFLIHILSIENGKELFSIKTNIDDISANYPNFIVFSPDGTLLAVATSEKILILKLANDNAELSRKIESTTDNIFTCLAFSPDGTKLVSGSIENKVRVWNVENGSMVATMVGHTMAITGVAFLSNGEKVVSASSDGTIRVWSINGTLALDITTLKSRVSSFAVSPDGQYLLSSSQDGKIIIFRSIDGTVLGQITGHTTFVRSVLFLPDDSMLISSSWDKSISVWKIVEGTKSKSLEGHSGEVQSLAISPDGKTIASAGWDDQIIIWDLQNMKMVNKIKYNFGNVLSIKYTPDGQSIIVCSDDGTVTKWNISGTSFVNIIRLSKVISTRLFIYGIELNYTQALEQNFENPYNIADMLLPSKSDQFAWDSTILQNSNKIAIGTTGGEIKILDLENSQIVKSIKSDLKEIRAIASSKDDRMITIGGFDGSVQSFDTNSGEIIWSVPDSYKQVRSLTYSPDGQLIAAAFSDGMIKIIDASNGKLLTTLYGHTNWVNAVAFSSDGRLLASASDDGTIIIWGIIDVEKTNSEKTTYSIDQNTSEITPSSTQSESTTNISTSLTRTFEMNNRPQERDLISLDNLNNIVILAKLSNKHARQITFSPDGKLLAIALSAGGEIIQVENQIQVATLNNSLSPTRITFSNNGDLIATASNHTIDVSNTSTWEKMKTLNVNINTVSKGEINALAFSSTGKYLAAALSDKVPIWEVSTFDMMNPIDGNCIYLDNILFYDRDQYLLSGYCSYIRLSNISSGSLLRQRKIEDWLTSLALSPVNDFFVSGSRNGTITLWSLPDITKKKEEYFSSKIINLTFSHDGSFIIAGIDDKVAFLSVNDAKLLNNFAFTSKVVTIAISPLGDLIAAGTEDGNIYLLGVNK